MHSTLSVVVDNVMSSPCSEWNGGNKSIPKYMQHVIENDIIILAYILK